LNTFSMLILGLMILGSIAVSFVKNLMSAVIVFMIYSLMMAVLWEQLNAPDLAITEAAVGAGITTVLFVLAIRRVRRKVS
jgi:energy-converting hydrogenase B subunit D